MGYWHQRADKRLGSPKAARSLDKVRRPQVSLGYVSPWNVKLSPVLYHCWLGRQESHPACKKLGIGLLVMTIWLECVLCAFILPYCTASWTTYCDDFSPSRMRQLAWLLHPAGQTISLQSCDGSTGYLWGDVSSLSWLCSYTSRWMVQHLATCPMTASLSQMLAAIGFAHLMSPPMWSRALTQASATGPSKSLDPDSGTVCRLHCVSPTRQSASSRNCWRLICLAETAAH